MTIMIATSFRPRAEDQLGTVAMHPTGDAIVALHGLGRSFNGRVALSALTFDIAAGEIFAVVGAPGAGRSTLLALLAGSLTPSTGSATVAGFALDTQVQAVRAAVGLVPADVPFDHALSGRTNLTYALRTALTPDAREAHISETLEDVGLADVADLAVSEYSPGMIRRLEIARATLHRPRVLFLDEPTRGLDRDERHLVWKHLLDLRALHGTTLVFTTGRAAEAEHHADRMAVLRHGELTALGQWEAVAVAACAATGVVGGPAALHDSEPRLRAIRTVG